MYVRIETASEESCVEKYRYQHDACAICSSYAYANLLSNFGVEHEGYMGSILDPVLKRDSPRLANTYTPTSGIL